jgi:hypothetical protein
MSEVLPEAHRDRTLQHFAHYATIAAAFVAVAAFVVGAWFTWQAAKGQAEAAAVAVLQDYFKLAIDHPDLADWPEEKPVDDRYEWFASHAYFTAETIFIHADETEWRNTARSIVRLHHAYVRDGRFSCEDFNPDFVDFVRAEVPDFRCAQDID